jgi:hypothetical protein
MSETLTAKWLKQAQQTVNGDPAFKKLGTIDTNMALKIGRAAFLVNFAGFSCHDVKKIAAKDLRDADFVIEMNQDLWDRFLAGRRRGDGVTLTELDTTDAVVKSDDPRKKLEFFRYHVSLQAFLDAGARAA